MEWKIHDPDHLKQVNPVNPGIIEKQAVHVLYGLAHACDLCPLVCHWDLGFIHVD